MSRLHAISLGKTRDGMSLRLTPKQRATHVHIIGGSGKGKSRLMEAMIRQDIHYGHGLCLIDPHGSLCDAVIRWMANYPSYQRREIILFEPGIREFVVGYNPLEPGERSYTATADTILEALAAATKTKADEAPRLKRILKAVLYALIERGLTLNEAMYLVEPADPYGFRKYITSDIEFSHFRDQWQSYLEMAQSQGGRRFREEFESTYNRLNQFLDDRTMRLIFGQKERVLNLRRFMDESAVVLINLGLESDVMSGDDAVTIGTLLLNDFYQSALQRGAGARPFYLYIDECYDFLTSDVERMLDQTRKFGLHLTLAHQRLGQLRARGEEIHDAVMEGAQTKVVFGVREHENAKELAVDLFASTFNLETPKESMRRPVVVGQIPVWLESESFSEGSASSWSEGSAAGESQSMRINVDEDEQSPIEVHSGSESESNSESYSSSSSQSYGRHQTLQNVYKELPTQLYSLDELIFMAARTIRSLKAREVIVHRVGDAEPARITTPDVPDEPVSDWELGRLKRSILERSGVVTPREEASRILEVRAQQLREWALRPPVEVVERE